LYDPASDANNNFHAFATGEWIDAKESLLEEGNARLASLRLISPPTEIAEDWAAVEGYWLTYIDLAAALPEGGELDGRPEAPVDSFNALIDYTVTNCP
jgi:hypothetical protein